MGGISRGLALAVGVIVVGVVLVFVLGHDSSTPGAAGGGDGGASRVASEAGASGCFGSGYYVESKFDGKRQTIYDCTVKGKLKCVTENGGIASDSTELVRLLFANTLGAHKPSCLS